MTAWQMLATTVLPRRMPIRQTRMATAWVMRARAMTWPTGDSLAYQTDAGVAEARFDQRLRSVQMASPGQVATLVWPADSSHVDIELVLNRIRTTSSTPVDFSDAALLAALDAAEDEGADVAVYRQYVADHPGQIQLIVTGQQPPSSASKQGWLEQQQQVIDPTVQRYLNKLSEVALICRATSEAIYQQLRRTPEEDPIYEHLLSLQENFNNLFFYFRELNDAQYRECVGFDCTPECNVDCSAPPVPPDEMACCLYEGDSAQCLPTSEQECMDKGGKFHEGASCFDINCEVGACCIDVDDTNPEPPDFNQAPRCSPATHQQCDQIAIEQPGLVTRTTFHLNQECSKVICTE